MRSFAVETPAGQLLLMASGDTIINTQWIIEMRKDMPGESQWQNSFDAYWHDMSNDIEVNLLKQGTLYRRRVWSELSGIPYGETRSYAALAKKLGSSARAVGNACRENPYALIIPCHRVISASGLGGYCGQTEGDFMQIKIKLLQFEAKNSR